MSANRGNDGGIGPFRTPDTGHGRGHRTRRLRSLVVAFVAVLGGAVPIAVVTAGPAGALTLWSTERLSPYVVFADISCPSTSDCVAVGEASTSPNREVETTTDGGTTWVVQPAVAGTDPNFTVYTHLVSVSCAPGTSDCVAIGGIYPPNDSPNAFVSTDLGVSWTVTTLPSGVSDSYLQVSCATASDCVAVGPAGAAYTKDGGATWSKGSLRRGFQPSLIDVSCPTASDCVAVTSGSAIVRSTNGGATWTSATVPAGAGPFVAVSCGSDSDCMAVGSTGGLPFALSTTDGGKVWSADTAPAPGSTGETPYDVSCATGSDCVVGVGLGGNLYSVATSDQGTTWPTRVIQEDDPYVGSAISCPSTVDCQATGSWTPPEPIGPELGFVAGMSTGPVWIPPPNVKYKLQKIGPEQFQLPVVGYPQPVVTLESGVLPPGLRLSSDGTFSGTPTQDGTFDLVLAASNGPVGGPPPATLDVEIDVVDFGIVSQIPPTVVPGTPYSFQLTAAGGTAPYKWKALTHLPKGLKLNAKTGLVSGTPSAKTVPPGYTGVDIQVTDSTPHGKQSMDDTIWLDVG